MKKQIFAAFLASALTVGIGGSLVKANADVVGQTDTGYQVSTNKVTVTYAENGYSTVSGLGSWGYCAYLSEPVKFDGLTVSFDSAILPNGSSSDCVGFFFGTEFLGGSVFPGGLAVTNWKLYSNQSRLVFGANHDYNGAALVYTTPECTTAGFGVAGSHVSTAVERMGYSITFEEYNETLYSVTVAMTHGEMWTNNANYDAETKTSTVYLKKETMAPLLDANGYTHITFAGFPSEDDPAVSVNVKVEDDLSREYQTTSVAPVKEKVAAYKTAAEAIATTDDYDAAMALREEALTAANALRAREKAEQTEAITAVDEALAADPEIVAVVKKAVQDKIDAATAAFDAFKTESNLTNEAYQAAVTLIQTAKTEYEDRKSMLDEAAQTELDEAFAELDYTKNYYKALQWVVGYEKAVAAIDPEAATVGDDIAAVKAMKNALAGSSTETLINGMNETDKAAISARIAAADTALAAAEEAASSAVKESYLTALETALEKDLVTSYANIQSAFAVLDNLKENVAIVEADGALYTRYTTAVETLYKALEDFVSGAITDLSQSLDGEFPTLDSFLQVRSAYNQIVLDLLDEEREDYTKIVEAHEALTEKLQANLWYNFSQTGLSTVEQNDTGVYFEMTAKFPARINYNEKLNMATGITAEIEFTNIAYYNGDKTESGASKGANNISINFLSAPDSYKSMASGLNIIIWLFEQESSVDIVNARDQSVAHGVLSTPINGGKLTISVVHGMYEDFAAGESYKAYIITINGQEIVLADALAESNGMEISDECYFSFGSFADYTADPNCFTLLSVNDTKFAKQPPAPGPDSSTSSSSSSGEETSSSENSSQGGSSAPRGGCNGCGSIMTGGIAGIAAVGAAVSMILTGKKRKKD